jgi:hypothetical protein
MPVSFSFEVRWRSWRSNGEEARELPEPAVIA